MNLLFRCLQGLNTRFLNRYSDPCGHEKPTHYIVAGRNGAGKSLLLSAIAGDGKTVAGKREFDSEVAQVSIAAQQALIEEERRKDSADILDVIATPTRVRELLLALIPTISTTLFSTH